MVRNAPLGVVVVVLGRVVRAFAPAGAAALVVPAGAVDDDDRLVRALGLVVTVSRAFVRAGLLVVALVADLFEPVGEPELVLAVAHGADDRLGQRKELLELVLKLARGVVVVALGHLGVRVVADGAIVGPASTINELATGSKEFEERTR